MNQLSQSWYRPDPTFRRYLEAVRPQGQLLPAQSHASPKRMVQSDDFFSMTHQSKKKRVDEDSIPPDAGAKPVQLQRRRVWRACESCRRKKIKCDGCEPNCSQCQASGSQCTWLQTKDRAALSRHYVQELEARLLHMESLFSQITPVLEQLGPSFTLPVVPGTSSIGSEGFPLASTNALQAMPSKAVPETHTSDLSSPESSSIKMEDDVSESFGQLALDEHGHMRWIGGSSTMSLIHSFRTLTTSPLHRVSPVEEDPRAPGPSVNKLYFPASVFFGKVHALPGPEEVEYPDEDLCDKLVHAYFERFHFLMPILEKPSFMSKYKELMTRRDDIDFIQSQAAFISVVFAVFACAARLVNDARLITENLDDGGIGMIYYERALILHYISHASIQLSHVQSFILMSSFLCSVNCLPQAWLLVGQAVRTAQDLGLHRSPRRLTIPTIDKETRRKVWWGVYCLDRMLALALGRPLGIEDADCDVELPVTIDDENLADYFNGANPPQKFPSLMTGALALIILYQIAGRILRQVYAIDNCKDHLEPEKRAELLRSVEDLDSELNKWWDDLPPTFKSEAVTDQHVSMGAVLCSHYYSVLTTLHRNFLPVKRDQPVLPRSTLRAVSSAHGCIRLASTISNVVPPSHHLAFFIQHLFSSAVIVLLYAMNSPDSKGAANAMDVARSCLAALGSWEGQWPGARKCRELLMELTNTAEEAIRKGNGENRQVQMLPMSPVAPAMLERRQSLVPSPAQASMVNRPIKSRPRKVSRSRDPVSARRQMVTSPYHVDSQRNRSTSRKRGHDESKGIAGSSMNYQGSFSSPQAPLKPSPHSSPASVNLPSPSMSTLETPQQESSSNLMGSSQYSYSGPPLSPLHVPSPYDYTMHHSPLVSSSTNQWDASPSESRGIDMYTSPTQSSPLSYTNYEAQSNTDASWYTGSSDQRYSTMSTTPPGASFAAPGLPFLGLEYIRNYNSNGYSVGGETDSVWQAFDAGAFVFDPELPFTLGDTPPDLHEGQHSSPPHS